MTELEKQEKELARARKKYPNVHNEQELKDLVRMRRKKRDIWVALLGIGIGVLLMIGIRFIPLEEGYLQCLFLTGIVMVMTGCAALFRALKKNTAPEEDGPLRIDTARLKENHKHDAIRILLSQLGQGVFIGGVLTAAILVLDFMDVWLWFVIIFAAMALVYMAVDWTIRIVKSNKLQRRIAEGDFCLLQTALYDKEIESDSDTSSYYFKFLCHGKREWDYTFKHRVSETAYRLREPGDPCVLVLAVNQKKNRYDIKDIIWAKEIVIAQELRPYEITENDVVNKNSLLARNAAEI